MTSEIISLETQTEKESTSETWQQMFPPLTDPEEIQRRILVRQQLKEMYMQSPSYQARAERLAKRGIDYWATFDLGIIH